MFGKSLVYMLTVSLVVRHRNEKYSLHYSLRYAVRALPWFSVNVLPWFSANVYVASRHHALCFIAL